MNVDELEIRPYRPGDEVGILETFNRVFREVCGPDFVDRTMEQWRWQYLDNPVGHRMSLAVAKDGTIVSQYAGVPLRVDTAFGPQTFVHCVDSFTHPDWRKGLKRPGVFVITGLPFSAHSRQIDDCVLYGYPVPMAERIGRRFLEYHFLRTVNYLCRPVGQDPVPAPAAIEVEQTPGIPEGIDELYAAMAADKRCQVRRDRAYLEWRYVRIPTADDYEIHTARRNGELAGLLVLRPEHELVPDSCTIADWIVPTGDVELLDALLAAACRRAQQRGRKKLMAVFADPSWEYRAFQERGFAVTPSAEFLERRLTYLVTSQSTPIDGDWLLRHWWYTLGDSDLV